MNLVISLAAVVISVLLLGAALYVFANASNIKTDKKTESDETNK